MNTKKYILELNEFPIIASKIVDSLTRDLYDFHEFSETFNVDFINKMTHLIGKTQINDHQYDFEAVFHTIGQYVREMYPHIKHIEKETKTNYSNLLFDALEIKDFLIVKKELKRLITTIENNQYLFIEKPLDPALLITLRQQLSFLSDNPYAHTTMLNEAISYDHLWDMMKQVCIAGQSLYKNIDMARAKEYSFKQLQLRWGNNHTNDMTAA